MSFATIDSLCEEYGAEFLKNTAIAPYTAFKIGGSCNLIKVNGVEVLKAALNHCKSNGIPFRILGRGSNVLISDKGIDGVVLLIGVEFSWIDVEGDSIKCQSGAKLSDICKAALLHSLKGIEFAYGIPGTAGGALSMNAGAFGGEMSKIVKSCSYLDENAEANNIDSKDMDLSYRHSIFSNNPNYVITKLHIKLEKSSKTAIKERMDEITNARRDKQPLDFPSAGSTFKRPPAIAGKPLYAAKLIEDCGLRGKTIGGAQISEKHSGFIINRNNATFEDVVNLIEFTKETVYKTTGIILEEEIKIWN